MMERTRRYTSMPMLCILLLVTTCGILGCEVKPIPGKVGTPLQYQEKVIAKDPVLYERMRVALHKAVRTEHDLLQVKIGIENTENEEVWCDIQVVFYDKDKFELEKTNWQPLLLLRKQITYYDTVSLSSGAHDYTIFLRNPRRNKRIK